MDEHPNAATLRQALDALNTGDMTAGMDLLADDVEWYEIGRSEPTRGKQALAERYQSGDASGWDITGEVHDIVANDDHAVALVSATARKPDGQEFHYRTAEICHIKDGKITARWAFSDDTDAINRFFAS